MNATGKTDATSIDLCEGGKLVVSFDKKNDKYDKCIPERPCRVCLEGTIEV
jgi:hypothetical protein